MKELQYNKEWVIDTLNNIDISINHVLRRTSSLSSVNDFLETPSGIDLLDSVCMRLQVIGEMVKNLDKITEQKLLIQYPEINWKSIMRMRDIISHHYFEIDAEVIFESIKQDIPVLQRTIRQIISDNSTANI
ncbi:HepT-like ribonuclease domain-containing protein [Parabacteroides chinchillae]|uniref:Antitoxin n=1 Tax=Parabacteroides chinchillae TaxID=871327 RepID=A0A8G2F9F5_9BACT|nr:HepT-like ribonuclease domain-containing protein [Parabacteroides chinchillae]SEF45961.1 Protein of unknown function DUF86 [Parabacteroides chinchillae]